VAHAVKRAVHDKGEGYVGGVRFRVSGLTCPECAAQFQRGLNDLDGMKRAELNYGAGLLEIEGPYGPSEIIRLAGRAGLQAVLLDRMGKPRAGRKVRSEGFAGRAVFLLLAVLFIAGGIAAEAMGMTWPAGIDELLPAPITLERVMFALALLYGGFDPLKRAFHGFWRRRIEASFTVVCVAAGALLLGRWFEAAVVVTLFAASERLQASHMDRTRRFLWQLRERMPSRAARLIGEQAAEVPVEEVAPGDLCVVAPGEVFPVDGRIVQGTSTVSGNVLGGTGLSSEKKEGDRVEAGSVNGGETVHIQAERPAEASSFLSAVGVLEKALGAPGPGEKNIFRLTAIATPVFLFVAVALVMLAPVVLEAPLGPWLYAGLIILVVAQPCALALSVPAATSAALVSCAKAGVLAKSGEALGRLAKVNAVAFDSCAALTRERLSVFEVFPMPGWSQQQVLSLAAGIVWGRDDAIGAAVVQQAIESESGMVMVDSAGADEFGNLVAQVKDRNYAFGELSSLQRRGVALTPVLATINALERDGVVIALLVEGKEPVAIFALVETLKEGSRRALGRLKRMRVERIAMVSEQATRAAALAAALLEVDEHLVGLRPDQSAEKVKDLKREGKCVAMVRPAPGGPAGAGAPAAGRTGSLPADVDVVYGSLEAASRIGRADVMLVGQGLDKLPYALLLARRTSRVIRQNVVFVLVVKVVALSLLVGGAMTLWLAAILEFAATALVILNSMRLGRKVRLPSGSTGSPRAE